MIILFQNLQEKMSYWLAWRAEPLPRYAYTEMKRFRVRDYQGCIHVEKARATQAALLQRLWMECMWQNRLLAAIPLLHNQKTCFTIGNMSVR